MSPQWIDGARERFGAWRPWQKVAVIVGAGGIVLVALILLRPEPPRQSPPSRVPLVSTAPVRVEDGRLAVPGAGTVRPVAEVAVVPQVGGRVAWVSPSLVSGGRVERGETLIRIEPDDYANAVRQARAEVAAREVDLLQARGQAEVALEEYRRIRAREPDADPPDSTDLALVLREPQVAAAEAALERARAGLENARLSLARATIEAPFDGIVRSEAVDFGQVVSPGREVARIYRSDAVEVVVSLTEEEAALIPGLWGARPEGSPRRPARIPARVTTEFAGETHVWTGFVDRVEGALGERTRTVDVVVRVPRPWDSAGSPTLSAEDPAVTRARPPLLLGTWVDVEIAGPELDRYVELPRAALRDGPAVWAVRGDSTLEVTPVRVVQEIDGRVILDAGALETGDRVVVSDIPAMTDGMTIRVADREAPADEVGSR